MTEPVRAGAEASSGAEAVRWRLVVPSGWQGPVDDALPGFAGMADVRVCPDDRGDVLVVWRCDSSMHRLRWDKDAGRWPTDLENKPDDTELPDSVDDEDASKYRALRNLLAPDQIVAACVIDAADHARRFMLPDLGSDPAWNRDLLGPVVDRGNGWLVALSVHPPHPQGESDTTSRKLQLVPVTAQGWGAPVLVAGSERIYETPTTMAAHDDELDLFYSTTLYPFGPLTFPDSGLETSQLVYLRIKDGRVVERRPVYTRPRRTIERDAHVLGKAGRRYDLLLRRLGDRRSAGPDALDKVVHVADLLRWWSRRSTVAQTAGHGGADFVAVVRGGQAVQVVWLEEAYDDEDGPRPETRFFEVHEERGRWTAPRELFVHDVGAEGSLAAAVAKLGDQEVVVVIWRGLDGKLAYCLSPDPATWSLPQATELPLGVRNRLVVAGDTLFLVSAFDGNLYWCRLAVPGHTAESTPKLGATGARGHPDTRVHNN